MIGHITIFRKILYFFPEINFTVPRSDTTEKDLTKTVINGLLAISLNVNDMQGSETGMKLSYTSVSV